MTERRFDRGLVAAFVVAPPVVAVGWTYLLSGRAPAGVFLVAWVLLAFALRPAVWAWAAARVSVPEARAEAYDERLRNSASTAFAAAVLLGLAALDVIRLPGARYWTDQPRASFALAAVAVYLFWVARYADIPGDVREGWRLVSRGRKAGSHG